MDISKTRKTIADGFTVGHGPNGFFIGVLVGTETELYLVDPAGAKAFSENLKTHIAEYESKTGPIDISGLAPQIVSPIQRDK